MSWKSAGWLDSLPGVGPPPNKKTAEARCDTLLTVQCGSARGNRTLQPFRAWMSCSGCGEGGVWFPFRSDPLQ